MKNLDKRLLLSITGDTDYHYQSKIEEIKDQKIEEIGLFLERFILKQREDIYRELEKSSIKSIPLVHIRNDMEKDELEYLSKRYKTDHFTIHEDHFMVLDKWKGFYEKLFLEMNTDNFVSSLVRIEKIGGFCVDLSHFKVAQEKGLEDYRFVEGKKNTKEYFRCNHLNGYSKERKTDLHTVEKLQSFDYLKELPGYLFGDWIGIEVDNSIREQIKFKKYLLEILSL